MTIAPHRLVPLLALLTACGGGAAATSRGPTLAQLWASCQRDAPDAARDAPDAGPPTDPHVYRCTYQGARYELPEPGTHDVIDVDVDHIPYSNTAYERTAPYIVVRGLGPDDRVTAGGLGPARAAVGDTAMMLFGLATRGNAGGSPTATPATPTDELPDGGTAAPTGPVPGTYGAHTEHLVMAPGLTALLLVHHNGRDRVMRIASETRLDFLLGVSVSMDLTLLDDRPFGTVTLGDPVVAGSATRSLYISQDPIYGVTAHALIGLRLQDTAIWLGTPIVSSTGSPLSGVELHLGQRFPAFSQAMYFGLYGALRWANRPRVAGFTSDDNIEHLPRDWEYSFTFGIELQFDLLTLAGGRDGIVNAFSSD